MFSKLAIIAIFAIIEVVFDTFKEEMAIIIEFSRTLTLYYLLSMINESIAVDIALLLVVSGMTNDSDSDSDSNRS